MKDVDYGADDGGADAAHGATAQNRLLRNRSNRLAVTVFRLWHKHAQPDFDTAFADMMPELFRALDTAQYHTAADAIASTPKIMERFDVNPTHPEYTPDPWQWVGVNGNGMDTVDTMWTAITIGKKAVSNAPRWTWPWTASA